MIVVNAHFKIKPGSIAAWLELIEAHSKRCLELEPGCLQFDAAVSPKDPTVWVLNEIYRNEEALVLHRKTPHFPLFFGPSHELAESRVVHELRWYAGGAKARV